MDESTSTTSDEADGRSGSDTVLDFLYHDARRIGSFLAQFEGDGHLQSLTSTKSGTRGKKETASIELAGSAKIVSGKRKDDLETSLGMSEGYARVFDPYWANARAFLDYLTDRALLQRDLSKARIGQFVEVKGWLRVLDLGILKDAWKLPAVNKKLLQGAKTSGKAAAHMTAAEKAEQRELKENADFMLEMLHLFPHSIHATVLSSGETPSLTWCSLREEYLVTAASDLMLANGSTMPGEWSLIGILSAYPDFHLEEKEEEDDAEVGLMNSIVGNVSKNLAPVIRVTLGRPSAAYAVTPLLILRGVAEAGMETD